MTQIEDNLCHCLRNSTLDIDDTGASKDTQQVLDGVTLCVTFYEAGHRWHRSRTGSEQGHPGTRGGDTGWTEGGSFLQTDWQLQHTPPLYDGREKRENIWKLATIYVAPRLSHLHHCMVDCCNWNRVNIGQRRDTKNQVSNFWVICDDGC